jgi:hypothetical protein
MGPPCVFKVIAPGVLCVRAGLFLHSMPTGWYVNTLAHFAQSVQRRLGLAGGRKDRSHSTMFLIPAFITSASWAFLASAP